METLFGPRQTTGPFNAIASANPRAPTLARRSAVDALIRDGLPYSKKLLGHTSCVNALAFSPDGRWFASAGDDPFVQIWDFHQENASTPVWKFFGPRSNVFVLAFSASGRYVYSGDTQDIIYQYDVAHLGSPISRSRDGSQAPSWSGTQHEDSIRAISCHPEQDSLFLSAAEDGRIILHDMRANPTYTRAQGVLQHTTEFTSVQYHPTMMNIFATSDNHGYVCLRDVRMAFGPLSQRRNRGVVHKYVTTMTKQSAPRVISPEASSLSFDREGRRLCVTVLHHLPTLYSLNDPYPIATFSGRHLPDGTRVPPGQGKYSNSCTLKHGSFGALGSDRDAYYAQGSDDFQTYVWKIPDDATLLERRRVVEISDWAKCERPEDIGYTASLLAPRYIPFEISTPITRLTGHDSIVNTALIHPHQPYILTAGIERYVRLHSPTSATPFTEPLELTPTAVRSVPAFNPTSRELYLRAMGVVDSPEPENDNDSRTIALFDQILRQEGNGDVFAIRAWMPDGDDPVFMGSSDEEDADVNGDSSDDVDIA